MRLSANASSPFYIACLIDRGIDPTAITVSVNGKTRIDVVEADSTNGWAVVVLGGVSRRHNMRTQRIQGRVKFYSGDAVLA